MVLVGHGGSGVGGLWFVVGVMDGNCGVGRLWWWWWMTVVVLVSHGGGW